MCLAKVSVVSIFFFALLLLHHHHLLGFVTGQDSTTPAGSHYLGDVAINCGSTGKSYAFDGREWIGDAGSELMSSLQPTGNSKTSTSVDKSFSADPVPYKTSRISPNPFYYKFRVSPGQKFIRLHFHPAPYHGFKNSQDFFTVKAGPFTLLRNFSASFSAEASGVNFLVKEFCLNVEENGDLNIIFSPSQSSASRKVYAFVNGIEIISMPTGLYYTMDGDLGARFVGLHNRFAAVDNSTALELIERLSTGASSILSVEDFGLFRRWNGDSNYLIVETRVHQVSHPAHRILYTGVPAYLAPPKVYQTSWKMDPDVRVRGPYTVRWKMSVDVGFGYLVRLHFCDFDPGVRDGGNKEFSVLMNDQIAETKIDVISWSGGSGVPVYRDYMVMMKGDREGGKCDLLIALRSTNELVVGLLNGMEIFKLSNPDNSLASANLVLPRRMSSSWKLKFHKLFTLSQSNVISTATTILLVLANVIVYNLRQSWEGSLHKEKNTPLLSIDPSFCCFSLSEIISATQNFSDVALIGRGGFGKVYKGFITGISQVAAIKRLNANSKQGAREFWAEVETLSKFRHIHLVSLIGYCNELSEMILVYEYMPCGTLADNIYKLAKLGKDSVVLSWEQRLRICIGAARGLEYLHTGTEHGVIHRDVKDTNILLDEDFVAKISDFGLSKLEKFTESKSYISTKVKGTHGYLDPEYHMTRKLTRKVDVYAFGVVLLVVLSGRPAVEVRILEEPQSLLSRFRECITEGDLEAIVDPSLQGSIWGSSLKEFVKCVENCLHHQPKKRPTMSQVATSLELALEKQQQQEIEDVGLELEISQPSSEDGGVESMQFSQSPAPPMLEVEEEAEGFTSIFNRVRSQRNNYQSTKTQEAQLRENSSVRKPTWGWPWKTGWSRGKPVAVKKTDLGFGSSPSSSTSTSTVEQLHGSGPRFSIQDIRAAAGGDNFSDGFVDSRGREACLGFMELLQKPVIIYKINSGTHGGGDGGSEALKVYREIEKLSKLRHVNIQSLIGYCVSVNEPENQELLFIVYEHSGFESLDDHLYSRSSRNIAPQCHLSWKRRLHICVGVAKGLAYLQECTGEAINHYHLRLDNILLDENWTPKISHFGLSMAMLNPVPVGLSQDDDTSPPAVGKLIRENSDLLSFGLVLVEVLLARRINLDSSGGGYGYLISWERSFRNRTFHLIIDSTLKGEIATICLVEYVKAIFDCILVLPTSLATVASKLESALELQEKAEAANKGREGGFSLEAIYQDLKIIERFSIISLGKLPIPSLRFG